MLYVSHNEDGSIHQANKVYDFENMNYDDQLRNLGHKFVKLQAPGLVPPEHWYVDVKAAQLSERPVMKIQLSKTRIKAGSSDSALFTNCLPQARIRITTSNLEIHSGVLDAKELEILIPLPCIYRVTFDCWPFKTFSAEIEGATSL